MPRAAVGFRCVAGRVRGPRRRTHVSISLSCDDEAEPRGYWDELVAASTIRMPLEKQMWGDVFGMCTDPYGIAWTVNIAQPRG